MPADAVDHELRHGVEAQLAGLGDQHVAHAHEQVCHIYGGKNVLVAEGLHALDVLIVFDKRLRRLVVVKVRLGHRAKLRDVGDDGIPYLKVVAGVDEQADLARADLGDQVADDVLKELLLCARPADGQEIAPGLAGFQPVEPRRAVFLDILHEFVVDIVADIENRPLRHWL